jgi:hypothetical protein
MAATVPAAPKGGLGALSPGAAPSATSTATRDACTTPATTSPTWPSIPVEEAIEVMRKLWTGRIVTHRGTHYTVANARVYSVPETPPAVLVSAFGPKATALAARVGDGLVNVKPDADLVRQYRDQGGGGPVVGAMKVCWAASAHEGVRTAHRVWRTEALPGQLAQELPMPRHFTQATELVTDQMIADMIPCGPDPEAYVAAIDRYRAAGFDELFVNQIGKGPGRFPPVPHRGGPPARQPGLDPRLTSGHHHQSGSQTGSRHIRRTCPCRRRRRSTSPSGSWPGRWRERRPTR